MYDVMYIDLGSQGFFAVDIPVMSQSYSWLSLTCYAG